MALLRYYETTRSLINEIDRAAGNIINCVDTGEILYDVSKDVRIITQHIKIYQTLEDLKAYRDSNNNKINSNLVYVVANTKRFYIFNNLSGEFENILTQDDASNYINSWVGATPATIVKENKRYAPMSVANNIFMQDGDSVEHKINQLGLMTSSFENIQVTDTSKTFDIPVPFEEFFNYPHCMIITIGTTVITPNRYSIKDNKITFNEAVDIGRTINFFFMYNSKPGGNALAIENIDGANINNRSIPYTKLSKVSSSYLENDPTSIATSSGLKGLYDLIAALCNEKNITVRCIATKTEDASFKLTTPQGFTDLIDGDIMCIKFNSDVPANGKITYNGKEYPIYTSSTTAVKDKEICANDELYFQYNATDDRFYVTNGMAYRMDQFTYNKILDRDGDVFSYEESGFLPGYDTLTVYLNGLKLIKGVNYNIDYKAKAISLIGFEAKSGDTVEFVVDRINRTRATRDAASIDFLDTDALESAATEVQEKLQKELDDNTDNFNAKIKELETADDTLRKDIYNTLDDYTTKNLVDEKITNHHELKNIPPKIGYTDDTKLNIYAKINNSNLVDHHFRIYTHDNHYLLFRANNKNNTNYTRWYWAKLVDGAWQWNNTPFEPAYLTKLDKSAYVDFVLNVAPKWMICRVSINKTTYWHLILADDINTASSCNTYYDITSLITGNRIPAIFYDAASKTISVCNVTNGTTAQWMLDTYKISDLKTKIKSSEIFNIDNFTYPDGFTRKSWLIWNGLQCGGVAYNAKTKTLYFTTAIYLYITNATTGETYENVYPTFRPLIAYKFDPLSSDTIVKLTNENYNISTSNLSNFSMGTEVGQRKGRTLSIYKDGIILCSSNELIAQGGSEQYITIDFDGTKRIATNKVFKTVISKGPTINPWEISTGVPLLVNGKEIYFDSYFTKSTLNKQQNNQYTAKWNSTTKDGKVVNTLIPSTTSNSFVDLDSDPKMIGKEMNFTSYSRVGDSFKHLVYYPDTGKIYSYAFKDLILQNGDKESKKISLVDTGTYTVKLSDIVNKNSPYKYFYGAAYNPSDKCIYWIERKTIETKPMKKEDFDERYICLCQYDTTNKKTQYFYYCPDFVYNYLRTGRNCQYASNGAVKVRSNFFFEGSKVIFNVEVYSGSKDSYTCIFDTASKEFKSVNTYHEIHWRYEFNTIGWTPDYGYFFTTMSANYLISKLICSKTMSAEDFFLQSFSEYHNNETNANYNWIADDGASSLTAYVSRTPVLLGGFTSILDTMSFQLNANSENYIYLVRDDETNALKFEIRDEADGIIPKEDGPSDTSVYNSVLVAKITTDSDSVIAQEVYPVGNSYLDKESFNALDCYPVGSIYMNVNNTDPATIFGGKWEQLPPGRVLVGQGNSDYGVTFNNGNMGGEYNHTLSKDELPSFSFTGTTNRVNATGMFNSRNPAVHGKNSGYSTYDPTGIVSRVGGYHRDDGNADSNSFGYSAKIDFSHSHTFSIAFNGANKAQNNMQPYLVVYIWKRIL